MWRASAVVITHLASCCGCSQAGCGLLCVGHRVADGWRNLPQQSSLLPSLQAVVPESCCCRHPPVVGHPTSALSETDYMHLHHASAEQQGPASSGAARLGLPSLTPNRKPHNPGAHRYRAVTAEDYGAFINVEWRHFVYRTNGGDFVPAIAAYTNQRVPEGGWGLKGWRGPLACMYGGLAPACETAGAGCGCPLASLSLCCP